MSKAKLQLIPICCSFDRPFPAQTVFSVALGWKILALVAFLQRLSREKRRVSARCANRRAPRIFVVRRNAARVVPRRLVAQSVAASGNGLEMPDQVK